MQAEIPKKTVLKGYLSFLAKDMGISIPIFVYKKNTEPKKIERHMYHENDHGRIQYVRICSECNETISWDDIIKMVEWGENKIEISEAELEEIFNQSGKVLKVTHPLSLSKLIPEIVDAKIFFKELYQVVPFRFDKSGPSPQDEILLKTVFTALNTNKQALLVTTSIDQIDRNAVLFPSGNMATLYYEEEIREALPFGEGVEPNKDLLNGFKSFFKTHEGEWIPASYEEQKGKLDKLIESKINVPIAKARKGKEIAPVIEFQDILDVLKKSIEKAPRRKKITQKTG